MAAALGERELIELSVFHKVEELTCSVCLDLFVTPKKLPCGHTFCLDCLQKHSAVKVLFSCPLCRLTIKIPPGGIPYLPSGRLDPNICGRIENPVKSEEKWIECRSFGGTGSQRGQFRGPRSLAVSDRGEIFVADYRNKRVQIFDFQGTFLGSFHTTLPGEEEDIYPYGVTLDSGGNIWVVGRAPSKPKSSSLSSSFALLDYCGMTTNSSHYGRELSPSSSDFGVQYTRQGRYVIHFDVQNTRWAARGIAMDSRENNVIVTKVIEDGNSVVELFKPNGTLLRTIGDKEGIEYPHYVNVDREGRILVSDSAGPFVFVYNMEGKFLFKFGGWGEGDGQLNRPHGICTDESGRIFVADSGNDRVEMFDSTGEFLSHVISDIKQPLAVAMTRKGNLVVSNSENEVTIFHN